MNSFDEVLLHRKTFIFQVYVKCVFANVFSILFVCVSLNVSKTCNELTAVFFLIQLVGIISLHEKITFNKTYEQLQMLQNILQHT